MSLIKFNRKMPWFNSELSNFFDSDDFFKDSFWNKSLMNQPALNIKETEKEFEIELAAPGLEKEDFNVSIANGYLNISVEKSSSEEIEEETGYSRKEFSYNSFKRSMLLPDNIEQDNVKASYKDGILKLWLVKKVSAEIHESKQIEVS